MLELWETSQFIENNILMWLDATFSETKKKNNKPFLLIFMGDGLCPKPEDVAINYFGPEILEC